MAIPLIDAPVPEGVRAAAPTPKQKGKGAKDPAVVILTVVVWAILLLIIGFPLYGLLTSAFAPKGLEVLARMVTDPVTHRIIANALLLGLIVGVTGPLVGFLFAYAQVKVKFRGK